MKFYAFFLLIESAQTANNNIPPFTIYCQKVGTSSILIPLSNDAMINAPTITPQTLPTPPAKLAPPITQAAMASNSAFCPAEGEPAPRRALELSPLLQPSTR